MRWRSTFWLMGAAAALFGYIWFFERHQPTTDERNAPQPLLSGFRWKEIDSVQVHRTNAFVVLAHRTNNSWRCFAPVSYPAQSAAIESLLNVAAGLTRDFLVAEALPPPGAPASSRYGLDSPSAVLTLVQGKLRAELRLGDRTASKEQVYAQLAGAPGVYAVPASLLDTIPSAFHEWRDPALAEWATLAFDRVSVSNSTRGFTLAFDRTNLFSLVKPFEARADNERVNRLLRELYSAQVTSFVNDLPGSELDLYGLQPPLLELGIGHGTNLLASIHFGISPTNDPSVVYARLSGHRNVVLTSRNIFDALQISYLDLRDTRLVPFQLEAAESLEVKGPEGFSVRRQGTNEW
ncbi:MAG: DUF4340 domain-containing protein, partial [Verrucomicrobia bacterium]|nr:DUF4340 domain-containing protein [Verrucomicrobiota bacterium]